MHHRFFLIGIILVVLQFSIKELSARKVGLSNRLPNLRRHQILILERPIYTKNL